MLMLDVGLTTDECARLNLDDVKFTTTGGFAIVTRDAVRYRFPLDAQSRLTLREYLRERADNYPFIDHPALLIDSRGKGLTPAAIDLIVREVGKKGGMDVTARCLRQTYMFNEARKQNNALLASELLHGNVQVH
jgi:integrase